jgi:4-alpha-glucanotransferase
VASADAWGIVPGYHDVPGVWHETPRETRDALLAAMGVDPAAGPPPEAPVRVLRRDPAPIPRSALRPSTGSGRAELVEARIPRWQGPAELTLEDGTVLRVNDALPPDLPYGYHVLHRLDGGPPVRLIVSPGRCHLPDPLRGWGWAVQLYAARSAQSWGIGDLADLRRLARWSRAELGAGGLLVCPLCAAAPVLPQEPSPYYPTSRRYRNPLYLRIEEVPGAAEAGLDLKPLAAAGRALNRDRRIDRDAVFRLKMAALERLWARFGGDPAWDRYRLAQGEALAQFAAFCVLTERNGPDWRRWPPEHRHPGAPAVVRVAAQQAGRVAFHAWLQWLLDEQLAQASRACTLMHDLPIGFDPGGADAWAWQDVVADGISVGAPPDGFNTWGQDWGLPPFVPHRLRAAAYEPFVQTIRAALTHAGALRIDHVMGLFRLFWIPRGAEPAQGTYVRYPAEDLLAILALESHRAGAFVVGEDLGTVEAGVRERLAEHRILSTRLLCFEAGPPAQLPELAVAAYSTHDLPTIAGLWTGAEVRAQEALGAHGNPQGARELQEGLRALSGLPPGAPVGQAIEEVYRRLAEAPSAILTATLDDAFAAEERPNVPGTVSEWPNWSLALPGPLEWLEADGLPRRIAKTLARG